MYSFLKMVTLDKYGISGIFLFVFYFRSSHTYVKRCPEMAELVIFSKVKCNNDYEYHCLALHRIAFNNYKEECRTPEWVSLGNYPVLRGRYIDYETCPVSSYQTFLFRSNERYKCTYLKSMCSSDGQVEVNDGTTTSNKACRCDYNRGFAFVIRPQNQSACIPSQEDCSCYSKRCVEGQNLNPDYECKTITVLHGNSTYHVVTVTDKEHTRHNASYVVTNLNNVVSGKEGHIYGLDGLKSLIVFVVLLVSAFSLALIITVYSATASTKDNEQAYYSKKTHNIDNKGNKVFTDTYKETDEWKYIGQSSFGIETPPNREIDKQRNKGYKEINRIKTETESSTSTEKADIVILHIEENNQRTEVESFKFQLASLSKEMGYSGINIKLFEDVFNRKEHDSDIETETVLKKINFVFVYISNKFYTSKLRRRGLKESFVKDALKEPKTKTHFKIVSNCDYWELPAGSYLTLKKEDIDLDYFYYVKRNPDIVMEYEKTYKDCLEKIQHNDKTEQHN
ncbi:uncharacterized protein LOC127704129 isoform X2 [Mytilus californianus]|uniref:uncharacterized protein LOC127704129 isoform X2 n=1 Tax=Mytilus californianus TaxID=6549 RepID=UPI002246432A|nr:uncharacterized protein LOC127704129 isoform X2 [Mytilus californianus]